MGPHFTGGIAKFLTIAYNTLHALASCGLSPSRQYTSAHFLQPHYPHCCFWSTPGLFASWLLSFCFASTTVHPSINLFHSVPSSRLKPHLPKYSGRLLLSLALPNFEITYFALLFLSFFKTAFLIF